jgi:hypothetical protein
MRITSIEKLMSNMDDRELLDIYTELEAGKVPSTSYAHDFCRKVNRMVDAGELTVKTEGFRHIYLPSLRKLVYKEMAHRYACHLQNYKAPEPGWQCNSQDDDEVSDDESIECEWCNCDFERSMLRKTDLGLLCDRCIAGIRSRGDIVIVYE